VKHKEFSGTGVSEAGSLTEARWPQRLETGSCPFRNPAAQQAAVSAVRQAKVEQQAGYASKHRRTAGEKETKRCSHPLGQEASMLPAGHLPTMCMDANHAPLTLWRMFPVVYSKLL